MAKRNKDAALIKKLNALIDHAEELAGEQFNIDVILHDSYYLKDEELGQIYAYVEPEELKDGEYLYTIHIAGEQSTDLVLDSFAHELGHIIIEEVEECAADMIMSVLRGRTA